MSDQSPLFTFRMSDFHISSSRVEFEGKETFLTPPRMKVFQAILQDHPVPVDRKQIIDFAWGPCNKRNENVFDKVLPVLDEKLAKIGLATFNEPSIGYRLVRIPASTKMQDSKSDFGSKNANTPNIRVFVSALPIVDPMLVGREEDVALIERAWVEGANFLQIYGAGGCGKTALVDKWFRSHVDNEIIFGWSFASQGNLLNRQISSDLFLAEIMSWLRIRIAPSESVFAKIQVIADSLRKHKVLLILDGLEPMQEDDGRLRDSALRLLLRELIVSNKGLVVCTSRLPLEFPHDPPRSLSRELLNLDPPSGARYLRHFNIDGIEDELQKASAEYGNHPLALTLLGTFIADYLDHKITRRFEIRRLLSEKGQSYDHARRMISAYERMFAVGPEAKILRGLGYFDRPADLDALMLVVANEAAESFRQALIRLKAARLLVSNQSTNVVDCHPLVREHFSESTTKEGHNALYKYFASREPYLPSSITEMTPLLQAIYHGCRSGEYHDCLNNIYRLRILRSDQDAYLNKVLGAHATSIALLSNFFESPWTKPVSDLEPSAQLKVLGDVGFSLRALGRVKDALAPSQAAANAAKNLEDWGNAPSAFGNVSEINLVLGKLSEAVSAGRQAVDAADRGGIIDVANPIGDWYFRVRCRATFGDALHNTGDFQAAYAQFKDAEEIQRHHQPDTLLLSVSGYLYCDLLLTLGSRTEVVRRATKGLSLAEDQRRPLDMGLYHLLLGRALPRRSKKTQEHLDKATDLIQQAGTIHRLPLPLLARATDSDLTEVLKIIEYSGMTVYLADYHINAAWLFRSNRRQALMHLRSAEKAIEDTGYLRRVRDVKRMHQRLHL